MVAINLSDFGVPTDCDNCDLHYLSGEYSEMTCPFQPWGVHIADGKLKPENCPLIEVNGQP